MDEIIVRVARAIASRRRLRILTRLARHGETTPTPLAATLGMPLNTLSAQLRLLASVGLIQGRKSGAQCYYALRSPYNEHTFSGSMSRWLNRLLSSDADTKNDRGLPEVRDRPSPGAEGLHATLFEAATAFTDLRRLQILRHLETRSEATVEDLVEQLSMSEYAASRHIRKLARRGLISVQKNATRQLILRPTSKYKTPVHQRMHEIVRATWREE
ncbi:MAG: helix-turn-helix transcriptional regulator [Verrucomicrobia bacterium]|nr:helix-turn-helix transcriptional regulator [Verrucomicrobiota bacterium]